MLPGALQCMQHRSACGHSSAGTSGRHATCRNWSPRLHGFVRPIASTGQGITNAAPSLEQSSPSHADFGAAHISIAPGHNALLGQPSPDAPGAATITALPYDLQLEHNTATPSSAAHSAVAIDAAPAANSRSAGAARRRGKRSQGDATATAKSAKPADAASSNPSTTAAAGVPADATPPKPPSKLAALKAQLYGQMKEQMSTPSRSSVKLVLEPTQPADPPSRLRVDPIPPKPTKGQRASRTKRGTSPGPAEPEGTAATAAGRRSSGKQASASQQAALIPSRPFRAVPAAADAPAAATAGVDGTQRTLLLPRGQRRAVEAAQLEAQREMAKAEALAAKRLARLSQSNEAYAALVEQQAASVRAQAAPDAVTASAPAAAGNSSADAGTPAGALDNLLGDLASMFRAFTSSQKQEAEQKAAALTGAQPGPAGAAGRIVTGSSGGEKGGGGGGGFARLIEDAFAAIPIPGSAAGKARGADGKGHEGQKVQGGQQDGRAAGAAAAAGAVAGAAGAAAAKQAAAVGERAPTPAVRAPTRLSGLSSQARKMRRRRLLRLLQPLPLAGSGGTLTLSVGPRERMKRAAALLLQPSPAPKPIAMADLGTAAGGDTGMSAAELRSLRRRAYFARQIRPKQRAQVVRSGAAAAAYAAFGGEAERDLSDAADWNEEEAPAATKATSSSKLSTGQFRLGERVQYSDRLKRAVRKNELARSTAAAALKGGGAAAVAAAPTGAQPRSQQQRGAKQHDDVEEEEAEQRGDYNPQVEVLNDVYEALMGARLPEKALYGRRAEALTALSPQAFREQVRLWVSFTSKEETAAFVAREPALLARSPAELLQSLEVIGEAFGLEDPRACVELSQRAPILIGMSRAQVLGTLEDVERELQVGREEARKILLRHTVLLTSQAVMPLRERVAALGVLLPVAPDQLRKVLRRRTQLLARSLSGLAKWLITVSGQLGLPLFDVALMVAGCPAINGVSTERLAARWQALQRAVAVHRPWRLQLRSITPPALARCLLVPEEEYVRLQEVLARGAMSCRTAESFKRVLTISPAAFAQLLREGDRARERGAGGGASEAPQQQRAGGRRGEERRPAAAAVNEPAATAASASARASGQAAPVVGSAQVAWPASRTEATQVAVAAA